MQGLEPTQGLGEINRRYLREIQAVAPRGMGGRSVNIPGGNEGGVLLPTANLGGKKGITPVVTGMRTGEKEIGTFFHPEMGRGPYSKYLELMNALRGGYLSPRQLQSISGKMDDVTKQYGKDLRSALKEMSPADWDAFLRSHRAREIAHRGPTPGTGKEPAWTAEARRRLVEMGEIRPPPRPPARKKRKKPNMGKRVKTWHRR
tara:strand:+ start:45 stop:653 length:609 start_codon:yes stop_codon:yes gene_type:complete